MSPSHSLSAPPPTATIAPASGSLASCNLTDKNSPKLLWQDSTNEIGRISLDGQMTVMQSLSFDCLYPDTGGVRSNPYTSLPDLFTLNNTANKFTVVGCDSYGFVFGRRTNGSSQGNSFTTDDYSYNYNYQKGEPRSNKARPCAYFTQCRSNSGSGPKTGRGRGAMEIGSSPRPSNYSTGCTTLCTDDLLDLKEGSCTGMGCCQASIPENVRVVNIEVSHLINVEVRKGSNCSYGFVVEDSSFKFYPRNLKDLKGVKKFPMVVDWVIGGETCEEAKKNSSGILYACKSENSFCFTSKKGSFGYRCGCKKGYQGNPYLIDGCQNIDECNPGPGQKHPCPYECENLPGDFKCICPKGYHGDGTSTGVKACRPRESNTSKLIAGIVLGVVTMLLIACLAYLEYKRRQLKREKQKWFFQNGGDLLLEKLPAQPGSRDALKIFKSYELKKATKDFHEDNIVGQGGFGTVYRGILLNNQIVAIKKSKRVDIDQKEQFVNEVIVLTQINHRNVVKLLGCCLETEVPHLVYEFIGNGTLYAHLHNPIRACMLNWEIRLRIASETAGVLAYLHSAASNPIIHRDIKSENILLDNSFTAKVSDFGASRLISLDQTQISTVVQGTLGYLDPEYFLTHQLTKKSDFYSFGVVLLELITGRSAVRFTGPEKERSLVGLSTSMMEQKNFFLLVDGCIATDQNKEEIMEVARIANLCVKIKGVERPDMKVVSMELESLRLKRKKSLVIKVEENNEEKQALLGEGFDGIIADGGGSNSTTGSSSSTDQLVSPMSRGR